MTWDLPRSLTVNDTEYAIRTDFRDILQILAAFDDRELEPEEKGYVCLFILFEDYEDMPTSDYQAAYKEAVKFIDGGVGKDGTSPRTMDWEQDAQVLFPAINKAAGYEVRSVDYLHWWTFLGYFMEIKDSVYATILSIRQKKAKGKKLEKWEREFWNANRSICVLETKLTEEEQEEKDRMKAILG